MTSKFTTTTMISKAQRFTTEAEAKAVAVKLSEQMPASEFVSTLSFSGDFYIRTKLIGSDKKSVAVKTTGIVPAGAIWEETRNQYGFKWTSGQIVISFETTDALYRVKIANEEIAQTFESFGKAERFIESMRADARRAYPNR